MPEAGLRSASDTMSMSSEASDSGPSLSPPGAWDVAHLVQGTLGVLKIDPLHLDILSARLVENGSTLHPRISQRKFTRTPVELLEYP